MKKWDDLMRAWLDGDTKALPTLFSQLREPIFSYLFRLGRNPELAEDLLQETLVTICTKGKSWDPDRSFRPWCFTIARNKYLEWKRREWKIVPLIRPEEIPAPPGKGSPGENRVLVQEALGHLAENVREAFLLKHFAGLMFEEIADVQGIPLSTAKSRVRFAIAKLRSIIGGENDGTPMPE